MEDIHAIKPPIETTLDFSNMVLFGFVFLFAIFILWLIYFFWKKIKSKSAEKAEEIVESAVEDPIDYQQQAIDEMHKIEGLINSKNYKLFYLELSIIIKKYLSGVYGKNFIDMTSVEILDHKGVFKEKYDSVENFLIAIDFAKFANKNQEEDTAKHIFSLAKLVIK